MASCSCWLVAYLSKSCGILDILTSISSNRFSTNNEKGKLTLEGVQIILAELHVQFWWEVCDVLHVLVFHVFNLPLHFGKLFVLVFRWVLSLIRQGGSTLKESWDRILLPFMCHQGLSIISKSAISILGHEVLSIHQQDGIFMKGQVRTTERRGFR